MSPGARTVSAPPSILPSATPPLVAVIRVSIPRMADEGAKAMLAPLIVRTLAGVPLITASSPSETSPPAISVEAECPVGERSVIE